MDNLTTEEILSNNIEKLKVLNKGAPSYNILTTVDAIFRILIKLERECKCQT